MTVTASFVNADWEVKNYVLQTRNLDERHTAINIADELRVILDEWNIPVTAPMVTDNASNMLSAGRILGSKPHIGCYAHTLNLAVTKSLNLAPVKELLIHMRKIVTYVHRSTQASASLSKNCALLGLDKLKLMQDVSTRWNSAFTMIERYIKLHPAICASLASLGGKHASPLSEDEIALAKEAVSVLGLFKTITTVISTEKHPTVSMILPLQAQIRDVILTNSGGADEDSSTMFEMKSKIRENLLSRYTDVDVLHFPEETTLLDPRFNKVSLSDENKSAAYDRLVKLASLPVPEDEAMAVVEDSTSTSYLQSDESSPAAKKPHRDLSGLAAIFGETVEQPQATDSTKSASAQAQMEVVQLQMETNVHIDTDPLSWWRCNTHKYPRLSKVAATRLGIPATSVASERIFSTAGDIVTAKRSAISPEHVDMLIFMEKNLK